MSKGKKAQAKRINRKASTSRPSRGAGANAPVSFENTLKMGSAVLGDAAHAVFDSGDSPLQGLKPATKHWASIRGISLVRGLKS